MPFSHTISNLPVFLHAFFRFCLLLFFSTPFFLSFFFFFNIHQFYYDKQKGPIRQQFNDFERTERRMCLVTVDASNSCKNNGHMIRARSTIEGGCGYRFSLWISTCSVIIPQFLRTDISSYIVRYHETLSWLICR